MDKKNGPASIGGKGFMIVLALCAVVLGASAWVLLSEPGEEMQTAEAERPVDISAAVVTMVPRSEPTPAAVTAPPLSEPEAEPAAAAAEEPEPETRAVFSETVESYVWPVRGDVEVPYAVTTLVYDATMADWRTHDGIDIAAPAGTEVIASAGGTVVEVRQDDMYGTVVEIDHANGVHSVYANLASEPPVSEGDVVTMGQIIGSVGQTALAEVNQVAHLHYAMTLDGHSADPTMYLDTDYLLED